MVRVGEVPNTRAPVPVSSVTEFARKAEVAVVVACEPAPRKRAREAVRFEKTFEKPERVTFERVGEVARTKPPAEPVSSVRRVASSAEVSIFAAVKNPRVEVDTQVGTPPDTERI